MVTENQKTELKQALTQAFDNFISTLSSFTGDQINSIPFKGSWTPGQVACHIILATDGVPDRRTAEAKRPPDSNIEKIRPWWEDLGQKFQTPEPLRPDNTHRTQAALLAELKRVRDKDLAIINDQDLTAVCMDFELPQIGYLTRYEWLYFIQAHLKRHLFQLQNILKVFSAPQDVSI